MKVASRRRITYLTSVALLIVLVSATSVSGQPVEATVTRWMTEDGVEYGVWGPRISKPAPILFVLGSTIDGTLDKPYYRQCGNELAEQGYLCVSIDLPCHGEQSSRGEPAGLSGWSHRAGKNKDFVAESNTRLSKVLDHLITSGIADADKVAACGTSRGGFLAIHFAAHDQRVKCAAGFAPVTDLAALNEFRGKEQHPLVKSLNLANHAERLVGRPVWIVIGDQDERVGTKHAMNLASKLSAAAKAKQVASNVELHVMSEPRGHTTPRGSSKRAAEWIHRQLTAKGD